MSRHQLCRSCGISVILHQLHLVPRSETALSWSMNNTPTCLNVEQPVNSHQLHERRPWDCTGRVALCHAYPNSCVCPWHGVSFPCQPRIALLFLASVPFVHSAPVPMQQKSRVSWSFLMTAFHWAVPAGEYVLYPFLLTDESSSLTRLEGLEGLWVTDLEDVFLFSEVASILQHYLLIL